MKTDSPVIEARYFGYCPSCGLEILPGSPIVRVPWGWVHHEQQCIDPPDGMPDGYDDQDLYSYAGCDGKSG